MLKLCGRTSIESQNTPRWVFLAYYEKGLLGIRMHMRLILAVWGTKTHIIREVILLENKLAILQIGDRYPRPIPIYAKIIEVLGDSNRPLYQVDGGRIVAHSHHEESEKVRLEKNSLQI